jgi:hypothetical protein
MFLGSLLCKINGSKPLQYIILIYYTDFISENHNYRWLSAQIYLDLAPVFFFSLNINNPVSILLPYLFLKRSSYTCFYDIFGKDLFNPSHLKVLYQA